MPTSLKTTSKAFRIGENMTAESVVQRIDREMFLGDYDRFKLDKKYASDFIYEEMLEDEEDLDSDEDDIDEDEGGAKAFKVAPESNPIVTKKNTSDLKQDGALKFSSNEEEKKNPTQGI